MIKREDVFITTKLWHENHGRENVRPALVESLKKLKMEYVDLYLVHTPFSAIPTEVSFRLRLCSRCTSSFLLARMQLVQLGQEEQSVEAATNRGDLFPVHPLYSMLPRNLLCEGRRSESAVPELRAKSESTSQMSASVYEI